VGMIEFGCKFNVSFDDFWKVVMQALEEARIAEGMSADKLMHIIGMMGNQDMLS